MSEKFVAAYHGGLGDCLQFSTLPERLTELGHDVYLLKRAYHRNEEIKDLVWKHNPYIKGEKDGPWNVGDCPNVPYTNHTGNIISNWESIFGLPEPWDTAPKIYYQPKIISELKDCVLVDLSAISLDYSAQDVIEVTTNLLNTRYQGKQAYQVSFVKPMNPHGFHDRAHNGKHNNYVSSLPQCQIESIFDYCDSIYSSVAFIGLHSGGHALSTAIQRLNSELEINCILKQDVYDFCIKRGSFIFPTVTYTRIK